MKQSSHDKASDKPRSGLVHRAGRWCAKYAPLIMAWNAGLSTMAAAESYTEGNMWELSAMMALMFAAISVIFQNNPPTIQGEAQPPAKKL